MNRLKYSFLAALLIASLALPIAAAPQSAVRAFAAETNDDARVTDETGSLSEAEKTELESSCQKFRDKYDMDVALWIMRTGDHDDESEDSLAIDFYDAHHYGTGSTNSGYLVVWDRDNEDYQIHTFGDANGLLPEDSITWIEEQLPKYYDDYGAFGPMYASVGYLDKFVEKAIEGYANADGDAKAGSTEAVMEEIASQGDTDVIAQEDEAQTQEMTNKPAWYPEDPEHFTKFHDEKAPRVVDKADLYTPEEEAAMESRLAEIRQELQADIVVCTDTSSYGLDHRIYAADFYDFNGYGIGDDYEGVILFICMDPDDRGWWTCCTGPRSRGMYTEEIANQVDDILYDYLVAGEYYEGTADWIENMRNVYITGSPYLPDWAVAAMDAFENYHDPDAPRVVDYAGLLTESERASLEAKAHEIAAKYDTDVVICTARSSGYLSREEFADLFYDYNGYGFGDNYDGIQYTIFKRSGYRAYAVVTAYGSAQKKLTDTMQNRLLDRCDSNLSDGYYYNAADKWLDLTDHLLRTGRVPRGSGYWFFMTILELLVGVIFAVFSLAKASSKMDTPKIAENADNYLVPGTLNIRRVADRFINSVTDRMYSPLPKDDDRGGGGGSSSGGSSYSSSYHGSSGTTHTGSGRRF